MNVLQQVAALKLLPVIKLDRAKDAAPLAEALCAGKLPVAEVTFRTDAAAASIETMTSRFPQMLVGAGSVSSVEQAKRAIDAGAKFLVCAGFSRRIVEFAVLHRFPIFPGVCTPTELLLLLEYDLPGGEVLPGGSIRRPGYHQSAFCTIPAVAVYAHRRHQRRECAGISGVSESHCLRR